MAEMTADRFAQFADIRDHVLSVGGQYVELPHHVLVHIPGRDRLVVTFDNRAALNSKDPRAPWGYRLIRDQGWGCLGVMALDQRWYRCPDLYAPLESLARDTLIPSYNQFSLYGNSMGGYGALAFAGLFPNAITVSFNAQTSLDPDIVGFETRFSHGRKLGDWNGPYADAAVGAKAAARNYVFYDPMVKEDKLHAERLAGPNSVMLPCPWLTHPFMPILASMQLLKPVAIAALGGTLDREEFYRSFRCRRTSDRYMVELLTAAVDRGHPALARAALERRLIQAPSRHQELLEEILTREVAT